MLNMSKVISFGFVSCAGLMLDLLLFAAGLKLAIPVMLANFVASACAVAFVYFASARRTFAYRGEFLFPLFWAYAGYQVIGVTLASLAVASLVALGLAPLLAKVAILPATFAANYLFMSFLTRRGVARATRSRDHGGKSPCET